MNSPFSTTLGHEIRKAAYSINNFFGDNPNALIKDQTIPHALLQRAKGLAFLTVFRAGFMFTGRIGTGLVIAKLGDGVSWSAPSAIGTLGMGWGAQIGGELTASQEILQNRVLDRTLHCTIAAACANECSFLRIALRFHDRISSLCSTQTARTLLPRPRPGAVTCECWCGSRAYALFISLNYLFVRCVFHFAEAVESFGASAQVSLGAELGVSAGPIGRSAAAAVNVGDGGIAPCYSYSQSKGLFAGISLEGAAIIPRKDVNLKFYGKSAERKDLLSGRVPPPPAAEPLYAAIRKVMSGEVGSVSAPVVADSTAGNSGQGWTA